MLELILSPEPTYKEINTLLTQVLRHLDSDEFRGLHPEVKAQLLGQSGPVDQLAQLRRLCEIYAEDQERITDAVNCKDSLPLLSEAERVLVQKRIPYRSGQTGREKVRLARARLRELHAIPELQAEIDTVVSGRNVLTLEFLSTEQRQAIATPLPKYASRERIACARSALASIRRHDHEIEETPLEDMLEKLTGDGGEDEEPTRFTVHRPREKRKKPKVVPAELPHERAKRIVRERAASGQEISYGPEVTFPPRPPKAAPENEKKGPKNGKTKRKGASSTK
jgi:hypothetical protein